MTGSRRKMLAFAALLWGGLVAVVVLADDLSDRLTRLERESEYDLALALIEDHVQRGGAETDALRWWRARLVTDPDRFDRLAADLLGGKSPEDSLVQAVAIARAHEQFARGQYLTALEGLQALPATARDRFADVATLQGMAAMAAGRARDARASFETVHGPAPAFALAQVLLADLHLRAGQPDQALKHADEALAVEISAVRAQALYARARSLEQLGRLDAAAQARQLLLRDHPRTVEAAWMREQPVAAGASAPAPLAVVEVEAPLTRPDYALQFGAFHDRRLALKLARQLVGKVEQLRVERDIGTSPTWYRVVGGSFSAQSSADAQRDSLRAHEIDAVVLRPGRGQ